jgi:hypothetical protein
VAGEELSDPERDTLHGMHQEYFLMVVVVDWVLGRGAEIREVGLYGGHALVATDKKDMMAVAAVDSSDDRKALYGEVD